MRIFGEPPWPVQAAGAPRIFAHDGFAYRLDAEVLSPARYPWAESDDLGRLDGLRRKEGDYWIKLRNDFAATDRLDAIALWLVDRPDAAEIVATTSGALAVVSGARAPILAVDSSSASVLAELAADDGRLLTGPIAPVDGGPRQTWTLEFARPAGERGLLVLSLRSTELAERAFSHYLASMGRGIGAFMAALIEDGDCACRQEVLAAELARLCLPLLVAVETSRGWSKDRAIAPIGPAVMRRVALPIDLPPGERVRLRIAATPRFWAVDRIELAPMSEPITPQVLGPRLATLISHERRDDVRDSLAESDGRRVPIVMGESLELRFAAPPLERGKTRSAFVSVRGYYETASGGRRLINTAAVAAHRLGWISLPRFAASLAE